MIGLKFSIFLGLAIVVFSGNVAMADWISKATDSVALGLLTLYFVPVLMVRAFTQEAMPFRLEKTDWVGFYLAAPIAGPLFMVFAFLHKTM